MNKQKRHGETVERPPIVAVMGHIDHGKSTLLDYIRKTNVVAQESGGITQHLSAYEVEHATKEGGRKKITFLDTPGHEAFSSMRSRGAHVADIAILVVSAEDGVRAQTKEALSQIREAGIPFIVAISKIDKPNANIERTKQSLTENEIYLEGYGGDIPCVPLSSKTGEGVPLLLDMILLVAELEELQANRGNPAEGVVIESHIDSKTGTSATLLIEDGTLSKGQLVVVEDALSPVRRISNFLGENVDTASFSSPVLLSGFDRVPRVGATFRAYDDKRAAEKARTANAAKIKTPPSAAPISTAEPEEGEIPSIVFPLLIKADVVGTLEAIEKEIGKLVPPERLILKIIHRGVGPVNENDIKIAAGAERTAVIGFRVKTEPRAADLASRQAVHIATFDVIYKITEWLAEEMKKRAPRIAREEAMGTLEILKIFSVNRNKQILGGKVTEGKIETGKNCKIVRRGAEIGEGRILELKRGKINATAIQEGEECGALVDAKIEVARGDTIKVYTIVS